MCDLIFKVQINIYYQIIKTIYLLKVFIQIIDVAIFFSDLASNKPFVIRVNINCNILVITTEANKNHKSWLLFVLLFSLFV